MSCDSACTQNVFANNAGSVSTPMPLSTPIISATGTYTQLSTAQSGTTVLVPVNSVASSILLPPATGANGCMFTFIASGLLTHTMSVGPTGGGAGIYGTIFENSVGGTSGMTGVSKTGASTVTFAAGTVPGDRLVLVSDGTKWYCSGTSSTGAFT